MILVLLEVKRFVRSTGKDDDGGDDDLEVVMMVVMMVVMIVLVRVIISVFYLPTAPSCILSLRWKSKPRLPWNSVFLVP